MLYRTQLNILRYSLRQPVRNLCAGCGVRYGRDDAINGSTFPDKYYNLNVEKGWYDWWKSQNYFKPKERTGKLKPGEQAKFSMVLPPPNVTGVLHLGHALTASIQDALVRYHRMRGCETVWIPGSDHAGIATQIVVEKQLNSELGISRHQLGREKFVEKVQEWKTEKGDKILTQLEVLGSSLDWSRTQFTLSPQFNRSVNEAFIQLFNRGIIYRKESLVNWSCVLQSTLSDIEVNHVQVEKKTNFEVPGYNEPVEYGVITDIAYKVTNSCDEIIVSTTRPETMLGDTAIAVHPSDERYMRYIGQTVWHPFREESIPIIADTYVDPNFGTGAVKITPAHDPNDFEVGEGHGLEFLNVLNEDGTMNENAGEFRDEHRFAVRVRICDELEKRGLLRGSRDHAMRIPVCSRTGDVVEPVIKEQWFIDTTKICELASQAVNDGDLHLDPEHFAKIWNNFLTNEKSKSWCISRQLWWGHRVPAYICHRINEPRTKIWVAADSEEAALKEAAEKLNCGVDEVSVCQDSDVLDTWFSSGIYPFAALGWPDKTADLDKYFPLDLMETGHDILFFWVARMVMLSIALMGKLPFSDVLLHGIICDSKGRKMSKSLGNVIDPMHMVQGATYEKLSLELDLAFRSGYLTEEEVEMSKSELNSNFPHGIPASGTDALRWALLSYDTKCEQINLDTDLVPRASIWCNKIWQVTKLLVQTHERAKSAGKDISQLPSDFQPTLMDMWILNQLAVTVQRVNDEFEERNLDQVTKLIRTFLYSNVCDVYVEYIKKDIWDPENEQFLSSLMFLHTCVMTSLKLMHPIMPFITEELYHRVPCLPKERRQDSIMVDAYPQGVQWSGFVNAELENMMDTVLNIITGIRSIKKNYTLVKEALPPVLIHSESQIVMQNLPSFSKIISRLSKSGSINLSETKPKIEDLPAGCAVSTVDGITLAVNLGDLMDVDKEIKKTEEKMATNRRQHKKLEKKLKGAFQHRLSKEKVAEKRKVLDEDLEALERQLQALNHLKKKK